MATTKVNIESTRWSVCFMNIVKGASNLSLD
jgi:hypothetical protein